MTSIKRRHFLQAAGSTLAAIGLSQTQFLRQADHYSRTLAQTTSRKLALLIGINDYAAPVPRLQGCRTDVELQRELLVHRFGFNPADIVILVDQAATRSEILAAFEQHLVQQAKPGDVVLFHYSGHGSLVSDPNPLDTEACRAAQNCELNGTLVAADLPTKDANSNLILPHIMGRSIFFLRNAVQTENLTMVFDSCYSGAGTRGNVSIRAASARLATGELPPPPEVELAYQQQQLAQSNLTLAEFQQRRQENRVNGMAIGSASRNQEALDIPVDDGRFHAGAFTYLMTRYLWQMARDESFGTVRTNLILGTKALAYSNRRDQVPVFEAPPNVNQTEQPVYFLPTATPSAEAVVTKVSGDQIEFWLGGVSSQNLKSSQTVFLLLDAAGQPVLDAQGQPLEIQQESRVAPLYGYGSLKSGAVSAVQPGMLLRERIVGLPANPTLVIGLDASLADEMATAQTALGQALLSKQNVSRITVVEQQGTMDYLLGRMTADYRQELTRRGETELPPVGSIGLFNPDRSATVADSFGRAEEPATAAVDRLKPKLKLLLVGQVLRAITATNSDLQIAGEIFSGNLRIPLASRGVQDQAGLRVNSASTGQFRAGQNIQFQIENREDQAVYLSCIAIDAQGSLVVLYPATWDNPEAAALIDSQKTLVVPRAEDELNFRVNGAGFIELLTLVSTEPLKLALKGLSTIARGRGVSRGFVQPAEDEALNVVNDLLGDWDQGSRGGTAGVTAVSTNSTERLRDTNRLAAFSTLVEIVE